MMIDERESLHNPMIILFTDGMIEIGPRQSEAGRTVSLSQGDVLWALNALDGVAPVHTIGLNTEGGVDEALLYMIAEHSTASAAFTTDADNLPGIFADIYTRHMETAQAVRPSIAVPDGSDGTQSGEAGAGADHDEASDQMPEATPAPAGQQPPEVSAAPVREPAYGTAPANGNITAEPDDAESFRPTGGILVVSVLFVTVVVVINTRWLLRIVRDRQRADDGDCLDIVITERDGTKSPTVTVELENKRKRIDLNDLVSTEMDIDGIYIMRNPSGLLLVNKGDCEITDRNNMIILDKKYVWRENEKLTFTEEESNDLAKLEITYIYNDQ
jgi:hypothetical protein